MPTNTDRKLRVFLCHSSQDKPIVRELHQRLNAEGWIDPWLDEEKLLPGQDWDLEIEKAVEAADAVIVCLSNNSVSKTGYVQREVKFVLDIALEKPEGVIFIIPLRLEEVEVPRRLRSWQYVDYFPFEYKEKAYRKLSASLKIQGNSLGIEFVYQSQIPNTNDANEKESESSRKFKRLTEPIKQFHTEATKEKITLGGYRIYTFGGIEFVKIPSGVFLMGMNDDGADGWETPGHAFIIPYEYYIGRFPITNEQYSRYEKTRNKPFIHENEPGSFPAFPTSWEDVLDYISWLNVGSGSELPDRYSFRLPSEAEWEKAARGTDNRIYPWGNEFDENKCNTKESGKQTKTEVGLYSPYGDSPFGASDMAGNVWEWTRTIWTTGGILPLFKYPYQSDDGRENENISGGAQYVIRGGSFASNSVSARVINRHFFMPKVKLEEDGNTNLWSGVKSILINFNTIVHRDHGFRLVLVPSDKKS